MIFSLAGIVISIVNKDVTTLSIVFGIAIIAAIISILSQYMSKINKNDEYLRKLKKEIEDLKESFKLTERIAKIEGKMFK